jgi:hypothetical protein
MAAIPAGTEVQLEQGEVMVYLARLGLGKYAGHMRVVGLTELVCHAARDPHTNTRACAPPHRHLREMARVLGAAVGRLVIHKHAGRAGGAAGADGASGPSHSLFFLALVILPRLRQMAALGLPPIATKKLHAALHPLVGESTFASPPAD